MKLNYIVKRNANSKLSNSIITKNQVKQMIQSRVEPKMVSQTTTGAVGTAGSIVYLTAIQQGDGVSDRSGVTIRPSYMDVRVSYIDTVTGFSRVIIFHDTENIAAAPAVATVLQSAVWNSELDVTALCNGRFRVIYDKTMCLSAAGDLTAFDHTRIKLKGSISFYGTGNTAASGGKNAIYMITIASTATSTIDFRSNFSFTDA